MVKRKRNRKKNVERVAFPASFAGLLLLSAMVALVYLWLGTCCESLGKELKTLENEKVALNKKLVNEQYKWAKMKSPMSIENALAKFKLKMSYPKRGQVVRLYDGDMYYDRVAKLEEPLLTRSGIVMNE